ncbi:MAG: 30S ribosomal protein S1 [Gemmatales bacterium]|nr:30S ribosomal protein S1 [Gemmatales bacterium]MCS7160523.1 30S ribosomal protein S1 [Gemmatales bacterium]MDW8175724.1 30S ribosomal protein S1 [Gemmatales bacterium]
MVNKNLLREFDVDEREILEQIEASLGGPVEEKLPAAYLEKDQGFGPGQVVTGTVRRVTDQEVVVDIGYKSEGVIPVEEWRDEAQGKIVPPKEGEKIKVMIEAIEEPAGVITLSYRRARRIQEWERFLQEHKPGGVVSGLVVRKVKGGLLVNVGVPAFLPASQVDVRRPADIGDYIGKEIHCKILKIDEARRNIVVSRRQLLEEEREERRRRLLEELQPGQIRKGIVKSITDFGAFVDLGGMDGLLHITDMSWGRVQHPREFVSEGQELEVMVLSVDKDKQRIAVGLKQKSPSPWANIEEKYPVGSKHVGEVVNIMPYGAFVKLEPGVEGLVHISEMSWTRRVNHPNELLSVGDKVEVAVLGINKEKEEISLGMRQCQPNPWDTVPERYPVGAVVTGTVRSLINSGAFVELEEGIDGFLHINDISWVKKVTHPSDVLQKGDQVTCVVLGVDHERKRIQLGMKQLASDPWETDIPSRYQPGTVIVGRVTKLTNFGAFVELEPGLEGLLHVTELADHRVDSPEEVVHVGDIVEVKVLSVDPTERKIRLSRKRAQWGKGEEESLGENAARPRRELKGGTGESASGQFFNLPSQKRADKTAEGT